GVKPWPVWPVSVITVAYPLGSACASSTPLSDAKALIGTPGKPLKPAKPPMPLPKSLWFQLAGSCTSKCARPSGAPKPLVVSVPETSQNSGLAPAAGTSTAAVTTTPGTPSAVSAATEQPVSAAEAGAAASTPAASAPKPITASSATDPLLMAFLPKKVLSSGGCFVPVLCNPGSRLKPL